MGKKAANEMESGEEVSCHLDSWNFGSFRGFVAFQGLGPVQGLGCASVVGIQRYCC